MPSEFLSPGIFQMLAALLVPLFYGQWRNIYMAAIPIIAFGWTLGLSPGDRLEVAIFEVSLVVLRVDSLVWYLHIFEIATFLSIIFAWHIRDTTAGYRAHLFRRCDCCSLRWRSDHFVCDVGTNGSWRRSFLFGHAVTMRRSKPVCVILSYRWVPVCFCSPG